MIFNELMTGLNEAVGMESYSNAPMTELEEMNAEIQDMIALESALDEVEAFSVLEFCDNTEATNALLAMRECGLESTQGMDPAKIYEGFGIESQIAMEAAKDVLARKAYAGTAAIKALIATCIKWLKSLFGITVATKKVFKSLETKAKNMSKELKKKSGSKKIDAEKLKRELPEYAAALEKLMTHYNNVMGKVAASGHIEDIKRGTVGDGASQRTAIKKFEDDLAALKTIKEDLKEIYDKSNTSESSGTTLVSTLTSALSEIQGLYNSASQKDAGKYIKNAIKDLENYKKEVEKRNGDEAGQAQNQHQKAALNKAIEMYQNCASVTKAILKEMVKVSDDCLTMSKGVLAAIY